MSKIVDARYMPHERTAVHLARLCYRVGLSIEERQPATTIKLLQACHAVEAHLYEMAVPLRDNSRELNLARALRAARCVRAIVRRLRKDGDGAPDQVTAALEIAERLVDMLEHAPAP